MKKSFFTVLFLFLAFSVLAQGNSEKKKNNLSVAERKIEKMLEVKNTDPFENTLTSLESAINVVTRDLCTNLSPFPEITEKAFNENTATDEHFFSWDSFLSPPTLKERSKNNFSLIRILFITFLFAEIIFMAVKGYLTDESGLLKSIFTKALFAIFLYLVVSMLPYLIEVTRMGFIRAAYWITGTPFDGSGYSVTELPGRILRNTRRLLSDMHASTIGLANFNMDSALNPGFYRNFVLHIAFWIARIIGTVVTSIVVIHVMLNVIEVYLLMGVVCVLVPFSVFSPSKFLGEKALLSLFSNLMELFVITVIVLGCTTGIYKITDTVMRTSEMSSSVVLTVGDMYDYIVKGKNAEDADVWKNIPDSYNAGKAFYGKLRQNHNLGEYETADEAAHAVLNDIAKKAWENDGWYKPSNGEGFTINFLDSYAKQLKEQGSSGMAFDTSRIYDTATAREKLQILQAFYQAYRSEKASISANGTNTYVSVDLPSGFIKLSDITSDQKVDFAMSFLILTLFGIFAQFYFLSQSSQITNSLLNGSVAVDGFGGAMMKRSAARIAGFFTGGLTFPGKVVGAGAKAGVQSMVGMRKSITARALAERNAREAGGTV